MHSTTVYDLAEDEQEVYDEALDCFSQNRTYQTTKDPLRTSLQQQYAFFSVDCYRRVKRNNRGYYFGNNEAGKMIFKTCL